MNPLLGAAWPHNTITEIPNPIVAITGHRPDKLGGYKTPNKVYDEVMLAIGKALEELKPSVVITGMALGVDQMAAQLCINKNIPFIAAIPFDGQESVWPPSSQMTYKSLLSKAYLAYVITPGNYSPQKMQIRNQWMVDNSNVLLAVWNGTTGGTANCITYANKIQRKIKYAEVPAHIWDLAASIVKPKKPVLQIGPPIPIPKTVVFNSGSGSLPISPFVNNIKGKAQKEALKQLKEAEESKQKYFKQLQEAKELKQKFLLAMSPAYNPDAELLNALQLFNSKFKGQEVSVSQLSKLLSKVKQYVKVDPMEKKTEAPKAKPAYHRVIDLDD